MEALLILLIVVGVAVTAVGGLWFLVVCFRTSIGWGLACIFIPFASLIFLIKYWHDAKKPFLLNLAGGVLMAVASLGLAAHSATSAVGTIADFGLEQEDEPLDSAEAARDYWDSSPSTEPTPPVEAQPRSAEEEPQLPPPAQERYEPAPVAEPSAQEEEDAAAAILESVGSNGALEPTPSYGRRSWGESVPLDRLADYVGARVEVHTSDGRSYRADLVSVEGSSVRIRRAVGAGHVAYTVNLSDISEVRVKR